MKPIQIFQDTFRILRTRKLFWVLGLFALLPYILYLFSPFAHAFPVIICVLVPFAFGLLFISLVADGGLIYLVQQTTLNANPGFQEVWRVSRARVLRLLGVETLLLPVVFFYLVLTMDIPYTATSAFSWLVMLPALTFSTPLVIFSLCGVMLDNFNALKAVWRAFQLVISNLIWIIILYSGVEVVRLLANNLTDWALTPGLLQNPIRISIILLNWILLLVSFLIGTVLLTLLYLQLTTVPPDPAHSRQPNRIKDRFLRREG